MQLRELLHSFSDNITEQLGLSCSMLRLDLLHPVVSGNKLFKLNFYLKEAKSKEKEGILTMGGAYSNHLVATAYAAKSAGLQSIGYVRGEGSAQPSQTLEECKEYGMQLVYLSREAFDEIHHETLALQFPSYLVVPQGGYGENGMKGASEILSFAGAAAFDCIIAACGTGTMAAGLIRAASPQQKIQLVSVLKNNFSIRAEIDHLLASEQKDQRRFEDKRPYEIDFSHHHGGYAKYSNALFDTMNWFYQTHGIPTDFVYTGKMVHAFYQMAKNGSFQEKQNILLIHSGGLQGNRSLNKNELVF